MNRLQAFAARIPLHVKLIAAVLALVTLGLAAISVAGVAVLRDHLLGRADLQLSQTADRLAEQLITEPQTQPRVPSEMYAELRNAVGEVTASTLTDFDQGRPRLPDELTNRFGEPFTVSGTGGSAAPWRVYALDLPGGASVVVGLSLDELERTVGRLVAIDALVGLGVLVILAGAGIWLIRASLRPLAAIEATAGAIAAGDLSRRVPAEPRTEVGRLGASLNGMLAQIEAAFGARAASEATARESERRMRRFVADAGHELRTPLTAIRGFAELYRQGAARSPAELDRLIGRIEDAAARMGLLVEDLLLLARLDRQRPLAQRPVDLLATAAEAVQEARVLAPDREIDLDVAGGMAYQVLGDEARLRQVLGNLLTNAITHTPAGSPVEVRLRPGTPEESATLSGRGAPPGTQAVVCEVADHGPGLSREQAERVFERFYRADPARSGEGGAGLGLAIVAALAAAHGGLAQVETAQGEGSTFRILLPLPPD